MFQFDINEHLYSKVHFIGIGGVSMSGIAELLLDEGYTVTGSDANNNSYITHLKNRGIEVIIGQSASNITDQDLFVYTDAVNDENEELIAARKTGHPCVTRGQFLGALMRNYPNSIAVSGGHGKSTTTAVISRILLGADVDPTILLGGSQDEIKGNVRMGESNYFLAEACEYMGNIRYYFPQIAIVLNIAEDHLDYYKNLNNIIDTFGKYMDNLSETAVAIVNADDENCKPILNRVKGDLILFGINNDNADYNATDIHYDEEGHPVFNIHFPDGLVEEYHLSVLGDFNVYNMLAAVAATDITGIPRDMIKNAVESYETMHQRMEYMGKFDGAKVYVDYGHHPTQIDVTLKALKNITKEKLYCICQPLTYNRLKSLLKQFSEVFYAADKVYVVDIYTSRESKDDTIHSKHLVDLLNKNGVDATYLSSFKDVKNEIKGKITPSDSIIGFVTGSVEEFSESLVEEEK